MTISTGQRARGRKVYRNRAVYRNYTPSTGEELDAAIIEQAVPLWRICALRANSRNGGEKCGNEKGRAYALHSPDAVFRAHGITFDADPKLYGAYERAVRLAANVKPRQGRKTCAESGPRVL